MEQLADSLLSQNQHEKAMELYQQCTMSYEIIIKLANLKNHMGLFREAILLYEQAFILDNKDLKILIKIGKIHTQLGQYQEALQTFKRVLNLQENHFVAMGEIGYTYYCMEEHSNAIDMFIQCSKFISIIPNFLSKLAQELYEEYKYFTALYYFTASYQLEHQNSQALKGLVQTYFQLEQFENSIQYCDIMIEKQILISDAFLYKSQNLIELNEIPKSMANLEQINQNELNYNQFILFSKLKGKILYRNSEFDECIEVLQQIVEQYPYAEDLLVIISKCYKAQNQLDTALQVLEKVFNIYSNHLEALQLKYEILMQQDKITLAQEIKRKIILHYF